MIHRRMTWFSPIAYGPDVQACQRKMSCYRTCEAGMPGCIVRHGPVKLKWVQVDPEDRKARRLIAYVNEWRAPGTASPGPGILVSSFG